MPEVQREVLQVARRELAASLPRLKRSIQARASRPGAGDRPDPGEQAWQDQALKRAAEIQQTINKLDQALERDTAKEA